MAVLSFSVFYGTERSPVCRHPAVLHQRRPVPQVMTLLPAPFALFGDAPPERIIQVAVALPVRQFKVSQDELS
ncbi:hypothetical protein [Shewanella chilikensis]|uniref:hypothetical protein n=1 Tax=Shewanella chilikensis TaxID=558541 RepID=UPI001F298CFC|nr:hypothetical protein [Shewanella chilikensis]MCE9789623.1 hypothetical protein [Shewanella chilikensis]